MGVVKQEELKSQVRREEEELSAEKGLSDGGARKLGANRQRLL